jgi:hypothetical protein
MPSDGRFRRFYGKRHKYTSGFNGSVQNGRNDKHSEAMDRMTTPNDANMKSSWGVQSTFAPCECLSPIFA